MNTTFTAACRNGVSTIGRCATVGANTPAMTTATAFTRSMSTPPRGSGRCCVRGCDPIGEFHKRNCRSTWASFSSCTTSGSGVKACSNPFCNCWWRNHPNCPESMLSQYVLLRTWEIHYILLQPWAYSPAVKLYFISCDR